MTYFSLIFCILLLVFVYVIYFVGNRPKKVNWVIVYSPIIFSVFILSVYIFNGTTRPLDLRNVEYTAIGMKRYCNHWDSTVTNHPGDLYIGFYKNSNNDFEEFEIPKETYKYFKNLWSEKKEVLIHEDSSSKVYFLEWNKNTKKALVYTKQELFINYFKSYLKLYDFYKVTEKQAITEKLFTKDRIDIINKSRILEPRQPLVYGLDISDEESRSLSNVSSIDPEYRPILCVWVDSLLVKHPEKTVKDQRSYWEGGKSNEVIFCVGINNLKERKIMWSYSFSWSILPELEKYVIAESLKKGNCLDLKKYESALISGYSRGLWMPRDFESYSILRIPFTDFTVIVSSILIIVINLLMSFRIKSEE